jgi:hypothetical protein
MISPTITIVAGSRSLKKACGRPQITRKKSVRTFLPASSVGEQTGGENWRT